jgi:hypothetical protein
METNIMFVNFLKAEKIFIETAKYYEGLKIHTDPGETYVNSWIEKQADIFRKQWNESICKTCQKSGECGHLLKKECENIKIYEKS